MTNLSKRTLKVGLFVLIAAVFWWIWNEVVTRMFTSGDQVLGVIAFWLGRWTFTGWIFYLVIVCLLYWLLTRQIERHLNRRAGE
jgi:type III secretory pathway component EscU